MSSTWVESIERALADTLGALDAAVRDCTGDLWEMPMWPVEPLDGSHQFLDADWQPVTEPGQREALAQRWVERRSTPWSVAWHALEVFDYDLNGELGPWAPPPPFAGHPHWRDLPGLAAAWSQSEILEYIDYCHLQVRATLPGMTEQRAATLLPPAHRYGGQPHARIITGLVRHTAEHASQIRQFITAATESRTSDGP